jgi:hypothetical protein
MTRYAANLLFQYGIDRRSQSRALCEKRIVVFNASNPKGALRRALQQGRRGQQSYRNADGERVRVRFVGIIDLIDLDLVDDPSEVYFSMFCSARPERLVRATEKLSVFRTDPATLRSAWWAVPLFGSSRTRRERRR